MNIIKSVTRKANKDHKCDFCESNIFKGEQYKSDTIRYDDKIYEWRSCNHCKNIISEMFKSYDYSSEGITGEDFEMYISENNIDFKRR